MMLEDTSSTLSDPLSSALTRMKIHGLINVALDAAGHWAVDFPPYQGFTLNVVQKGHCLLSMEGQSSDVPLRAGDCFVLTGGRHFTLASDALRRHRLKAEELFTHAQDGFVTCNGGGDFLVAGIIFRFEGLLPALMFGRLPPVIHVAADSDQAAVLRWSLDRFGAELRNAAIGRSLFLNHLAPIMLLQALRIYQTRAANEDNWLVALSDSRLSKVLAAMQSDFQRRWSIEEFAELASMSRSGFALLFKKKVGVSPMDFLTHWRMQVACDFLQASDSSLAAIASAVGYGSESAFSGAFNKVLKCRPGEYRQRTRAGARAPAVGLAG
jgi:AraC-like DNA-binding protein